MRGDDENVLYGGPDPDPIDPGAKSFGEVLLNKLAEHGNNVMFVSKMILIDAKTISILF